jgi:dihydroorotate dehydrogenase
LGVAAGPLLNGRWCLYYASLGFDVVTYKTVRSRQRDCYPLPNLVPVECPSLHGGEAEVNECREMQGSWAVSFGMPSKSPELWRADVQWTRDQLASNKLLCVSVVASVQDGWAIDDLADDYARCAKWAVESGADVIETNFSCPNVATCDGQLFQQPGDARIVAERVREAIGDVPLIIKIGHVATPAAATQLIEALHPNATALAMTNSIATAVIQPDGNRRFDGQVRGICGRAILDASTNQVAMFQQLLSASESELVLIGVGGAGSATSVRGYLDAGAHAVHLATAAMLNPRVALEIKRDWPESRI